MYQLVRADGHGSRPSHSLACHLTRTALNLVATCDIAYFGADYQREPSRTACPSTWQLQEGKSTQPILPVYYLSDFTRTGVTLEGRMAYPRLLHTSSTPICTSTSASTSTNPSQLRQIDKTFRIRPKSTRLRCFHGLGCQPPSITTLVRTHQHLTSTDCKQPMAPCHSKCQPQPHMWRRSSC
jgi:hypothetical protein